MAHEAEEGEFKLHAWAVAEEAGGAQPPEPHTGHAPE